jgi:hypothetical protein
MIAFTNGHFLKKCIDSEIKERYCNNKQIVQTNMGAYIQNSKRERK